jgi:hypothetical protein
MAARISRRDHDSLVRISDVRVALSRTIDALTAADSDLTKLEILVAMNDVAGPILGYLRVATEGADAPPTGRLEP